MTFAEARARATQLLAAYQTSLMDPPIPSELAARWRAQQVDLVTRYSPSLMMGNVLGAMLVAMAAQSTRMAMAATIWASVVVALSIARLVQAQLTAGPSPITRPQRTIRHVIISSTIFGLLWSVPPGLLFAGAGLDTQLLIVILSIITLCSAAFTLTAMPLAACAVMVPVYVGTMVGLLKPSEHMYTFVVVLMTFYMVSLVRAVFINAAQYRLRFLALVHKDITNNADSLAHLPNSHAFRLSLETALLRTHRYGEPFAMLIIDIDGPAWVKDYGSGSPCDELLAQSAVRLRACTREVDMLARLDGQTFGLIAGQVESPEAAVQLAERLIRGFGAAFSVMGREAAAQITIGMVLVPQDGVMADTLMEQSTAALRAALNIKPGEYLFFDDTHDATAREQRTLATDLRKALVRREFALVYQPLFNIQQGRTTGCEALLRWHHPIRGEISPAQFIPLAEAMGLIQEIGEWAIREGLRTAVHWPEHVRIALNMSALQFRTIDVMRALQHAIAETGIDPARVEIEVTETSLISDMDAAIEVLTSIREMGVHVALDDFGTGFSSLNYLTRLPLDRLKIDRSFVQRAPLVPASAVLLRSVCSLAHDLGMKITGEGVETNAHLAFLIANRVDEVQGYLLGRPMSAEAIAHELTHETSEASQLVARISKA